MGIKRVLLSLLFSLSAVLGIAQTSVTTAHNDNFRSGLNSSETILTPSTVNPTNFGLLLRLPVDGYIYGQPLYLPNLAIPNKGTHNVVFVVTQHNSIYAFDADNNQGANAQPLWHDNFGPSVPSADVNTFDISPEIGITSTPVIATSTSTSTATIFLVAKTKTIVNGVRVYTIALHALDTTTGAERSGSPAVIRGAVKGTGDGNDGQGNVPFQPLIQNNRPGLLYVPGTGKNAGTVFIGFASHGDNGPYHGWLFGFNTSTMLPTGLLNTTPNALTDPSGYPIAAGGIWQSGGGLAYDGTSIYFATGNGLFNASNGSFGDSVLRVNPVSLTVADFFAPNDQIALDDEDGDLGSGSVMLLPSGVGSALAPNLMVCSGKEGSIYLLNRQNLGRFNATDQIVGELPDTIGGIWGSPAYFNGFIYYGPVSGPILSFGISGAAFQTSSPDSWTPETFGYPGPTPAVSSNGNANGILWAIQADGSGPGGTAILHAYTAANLGNELYNSSATNGRDLLGPPVKFSVPTIVNGKVYVGTGNALDVFGIGKTAATPSITPPAGNYPNSVNVTVNDATPGASIHYTTDGSVPTQNSTKYTGPITFTQSVTFTAVAYAAGDFPSVIVQRNYQINATLGTGIGLIGFYYNNSQLPTGAPSGRRLDPTIDFNWNGASPILGVLGTKWSAQWIGLVQAETTSPYTFYTNSDDGVRVWVNGIELINHWTVHGPTMDQGTISLVAGLKYTIQIQYFQATGGSLLQLFWSAPGMPMQIVPTGQLSSSQQNSTSSQSD